MGNRVQRRIERAKELRANLLSEGRAKDAMIVFNLTKSMAALKVANGNLWRDNIKLREKLEETGPTMKGKL